MQHQPNLGHPSGLDRDAARDDERMQFTVFAYLVEQHPTQLTMDELNLVIADDSIPGADRIGVSDAVAELVRSGVLRRDGVRIVPTFASLHVARLVDAP